MTKLIIFRIDKGEKEKYLNSTDTDLGDAFFRVANVGSVPSLIKTIAEHRDSSGKPNPEPGYRLTETVPENREQFRDSGWEVTRVEEYLPDLPVGTEFEAICICYCAYKPLPPENSWVGTAHRLEPNLDSFGGDRAAYEKWEADHKPVSV